MSAVEGLTEVATRAGAAAAAVRAAKWQSRPALRKEAERVESLLRDAAELATMPALFPTSPVAPSPDAEVEEVEEVEQRVPDGSVSAGVETDRSIAALADSRRSTAARAEADASRRVEVARVAVARAYLAVLDARISALDAGDDDATHDAVRGYANRPGAGSTTFSTWWRHLRTVIDAGGQELRHVVADRPRDIAFRLSVSFGFGVAYLAFLRFVLWDSAQEEIPFLSLYAFSGLAGSAVCTNALCVDAALVQARLRGGERLWHLLAAKNLAMFALIGVLGTLLNLALFVRYGSSTTLLKATGMLITMLLLWFGVGNVLSVASPLRVIPLGTRWKTRTIWPFLVSFVVSYGVSYLVNLMLYWRIWAKQTLLERLDGPWIPVLLVVGSAAVCYLLFTVAAVLLADQPRYRRNLLREMVLHYRNQARTTSSVAVPVAQSQQTSPPAGETSPS